MHCPTLKQLPLPPPGKTGWPWTEESPQLPDKMPDGSSWPKISIVTPSLNQGQFIEETIRSVLLQGYPNLEYIIIDGGSEDSTGSIIHKYLKWVTYWVSEPDLNQSHAINKGFKRVSGEIVAWINSDDCYLPESFCRVSNYFWCHSGCMAICGGLRIIDEKGVLLNQIPAHHSYDIDHLFGKVQCPQPACFWKKSVLDEIGFINEAMNYVFDLEYLIRIGVKCDINPFDGYLASLRHHPLTKTSTNELKSLFERREMYNRLFETCHLPKQVLKKKKELIRNITEGIAVTYLKYGKYGESRKYFIESIQCDPLRYQNFILLIHILDTITKLNLATKVSQWMQVFKTTPDDTNSGK